MLTNSANLVFRMPLSFYPFHILPSEMTVSGLFDGYTPPNVVVHILECVNVRLLGGVDGVAAPANGTQLYLSAILKGEAAHENRRVALLWPCAAVKPCVESSLKGGETVVIDSAITLLFVSG